MCLICWQAVMSDTRTQLSWHIQRWRKSGQSVCVQHGSTISSFLVFVLALCLRWSLHMIVQYTSPWFLCQSGISIDTTGTTHLAGYSCTTGLRCGSIEVSSRGDLEKILSENLQEMFPYSCRKGHVPRRKSQKSFRIPNHPVKNESWKQDYHWSIIIWLFKLKMVTYWHAAINFAFFIFFLFTWCLTRIVQETKWEFTHWAVNFALQLA